MPKKAKRGHDWNRQKKHRRTSAPKQTIHVIDREEASSQTHTTAVLCTVQEDSINIKTGEPSFSTAMTMLKSKPPKNFIKRKKSNGWSREKYGRQKREYKRKIKAMERQEKPVARDSCSQLDCKPLDHNVVQDTIGINTEHIKESTLLEPILNETAMNETCFDSMSDIEQPDSYEIVTDEHVIALIEAVSQWPEIYNPKHRYHKDEDILYRVWKEVGRHLYLVNVRVSGLYCKLKWRAIKTAYIAYVRRKSQKSGSQTKYKYADYLDWLDPCIAPLKPRGPRKSAGLKNCGPKKVSRVVAAKPSFVEKPSNAATSSNAAISTNAAKPSKAAISTNATKPINAAKSSNAAISSNAAKPSNAAISSDAVKSSNTLASTDPTDVVIEDELFEEKVDIGDINVGVDDTETTPRHSLNIIEQNGGRQTEQAPENEVVDNDTSVVPKTENVEDFCEVPQRSQEHSVGQTTEEVSDMLFLKSILPDLRRMTDRQKNVFKLKTMQLIGDILYPTS